LFIVIAFVASIVYHDFAVQSTDVLANLQFGKVIYRITAFSFHILKSQDSRLRKVSRISILNYIKQNKTH